MTLRRYVLHMVSSCHHSTAIASCTWSRYVVISTVSGTEMSRYFKQVPSSPFPVLSELGIRLYVLYIRGLQVDLSRTAWTLQSVTQWQRVVTFDVTGLYSVKLSSLCYIMCTNQLHFANWFLVCFSVLLIGSSGACTFTLQSLAAFADICQCENKTVKRQHWNWISLLSLILQ